MLCAVALGCGSKAVDTAAERDKNDAEQMRRRQEISAIYEKWQKARAEQKMIEAAGKQDVHSGYPAAKLKEMDAD